jgi:NAD(P)-dependent dehydrogenase (short-subunit alcohol dehydrogenase family)
MATRKYDGFVAYKQSKQALRMLTWHLAEELRGAGVSANAVAPGFVRTQLNRRATGMIPAIMNLAAKFFAQTPAKGADTPSWLAASPEHASTTGKFFNTGRREITCKFRDPAEIKKLVEVCARMAPS